MPIVVECKSCGREFQIQGIAFANGANLKTAHTTNHITQERCSHCSYITTYSMNELIKKD